MATKNIFHQQVVPQKPKVLAEERIFVYMPTSTGDSKGLAAFNNRDFQNNQGYVSLRWPMHMLAGSFADPLERPSLTKVTSDEFVNTTVITTTQHPTTGVEYYSNTAEIKFNRENRDALARPDLVMLNSTDFTANTVISSTGEQYNQYSITRHDPMITPSIIQINSSDFSQDEANIVQVNWPYAHQSGQGTDRTNGFGLVKIATDGSGNLSYDINGNLQVDETLLLQNLDSQLSIRPTYTEVDETYVDLETGLARRAANGNTLINITKEAVGLSKVENRTFASRTYDEFGQSMRTHFETRFNNKLDQATWDNLFTNWAPPTQDRRTPQQWLSRLEEEDQALWASFRSTRLFLGFFETLDLLELAHPSNATLFGAHAFLADTNTYWSVRPISSARYQWLFRTRDTIFSIQNPEINDRAINLDTGQEFIWDGANWINQGVHPEQWQWYNTTISNLSLMDFVETDSAALRENSHVANVSVGQSGKWIQSDHVHPSDSSKLDADIMLDAKLNITTTNPTNNDFQTQLVTITQSDAGNNLYNSISTINIPFIRTTQFLHNWKNNPTNFTQTELSNEYYWAGSQAEFEQLDLANIPAGAMIHVDDGEGLIPGDIVTVDQIENSGITLNANDNFVIINRNINTDGVIITTNAEGNNRRIQSLNFETWVTPPANHRMAITIPQANGTTLAHRIFTANRLIQSDSNGNLEAGAINPQNIITTNFGTVTTSLTSNQLVRAIGPNTLQSFSTGTIAGRPLASTAIGDVQVLNLTPHRIVRTNAVGGLETAPWLETNLIKTATNGEPTTLPSGQVAMTGINNTLTTWNSGGVNGSLIVRGTTNGQLTIRNHIANNRILITGASGTLQELSSGSTGQVLSSTGSGLPGWIDIPASAVHLPQTLFTTNPLQAQVSSQGLSAVVLSSPIEVADMRDNCIYYY